jgi:hypothetical protein
MLPSNPALITLGLHCGFRCVDGEMGARVSRGATGRTKQSTYATSGE